MIRPRKAHWRHVAARPDTPEEERFWCDEHGRDCKRVWVREEQTPETAQDLELRLLDVPPDQVLESFEAHQLAARGPGLRRGLDGQLRLTAQPQAAQPSRTSRVRDWWARFRRRG
jgi:hypothetical protein